MNSVRRHQPGDQTSQPAISGQALSALPRDPLAISLDAAGIATEIQPVRPHPGRLFRVSSQLTVGIDQRIHLTWQFGRSMQRHRNRILGFRRMNGFAPEGNHSDLAALGTKIIDSTVSSSKIETLAEGEYFYTFILRSTFLYMLNVTRDVVQFSESIPSAKYAISRLRDTIEARELLAKLAGVVGRQTNHGEVNPANARQISSIADRIVSLMVEHKQGLERVMSSEHWTTLGPNEQAYIQAALRDALKKELKK